MAKNGPSGSWKVPQVSGQYHMLPTTLALGGRAPQGGWPKLGGGGALLGEEASLDSDSPVGRARFGRRSPTGTPPTPITPKGAPGHLYNEGRGWGRSALDPPRPMRRPAAPLIPVAP